MPFITLEENDSEQEKKKRKTDTKNNNIDKNTAGKASTIKGTPKSRDLCCVVL